MTRLLSAFVFTLLFVIGAFAQSSPGLIPGQVPTAAQWNSYFAAKQDLLTASPLLKSGGTLSGPLITAPSISGAAGFNVPQGTAPSAPNNGDIWTTSGGLFARVGGSTIMINGATSSFGGCNPSTPPTQATPVFSMFGVCGSFADSGSGNIFGISSWVDNTGIRPAVGVFGQGRALGTNSFAWGGNFVGYSGASGAFAQGVEIDFGAAVGIPSQEANGLDINVGGTTASNLVIGLSFDQLGASGVYTDAIRFSNFAGGQPYSNALINIPNAVTPITPTYGINFVNATFGTAAWQSRGAEIDPVGSFLTSSTTVPSLSAGVLSMVGIVATPSLGTGTTGLLSLTAAGGVHVQGNGSVNDVVLNNKSGTAALSVPTGTTNVSVGGNEVVGGTIQAGTNGGTGGAVTLEGSSSGSRVLAVNSTGSAFSFGGGALTVAEGGTGDTGTAWSSFTATPTCGSASITSNSFKSKTLGKTTDAQLDFTITSLGSCSTSLTFTLPNTPNSGGMLAFRDTSGTTNSLGGCSVASGSTTATCVKGAGAAYQANEHMVGSGVYENQ